jgi:hypothetical protein
MALRCPTGEFLPPSHPRGVRAGACCCLSFPASPKTQKSAQSASSALYSLPSTGDRHRSPVLPRFVFAAFAKIYALFTSNLWRHPHPLYCPLNTVHCLLFPRGGVEAVLNLTRVLLLFPKLLRTFCVRCRTFGRRQLRWTIPTCRTCETCRTCPTVLAFVPAPLRKIRALFSGTPVALLRPPADSRSIIR